MKHLLVLGPEEPMARELAENVEAAARELGIDYELIKVIGARAIAGFGVTPTPALLVDDEIKVVGRAPTVEELKIILRAPNK